MLKGTLYIHSFWKVSARGNSRVAKVTLVDLYKHKIVNHILFFKKINIGDVPASDSVTRILVLVTLVPQ